MAYKANCYRSSFVKLATCLLLSKPGLLNLEFNEKALTAIKYRPEIDGLRALAVIPVILFHMDFDWLAGGYIGVDVFFVISGFFITSIIKKELESGTFSFREFWARRVRRILPAMLFVTVATLVMAYVFAFRPDQPIVGKQSVAALLSVANIYFWRTSGDYWGTKAEESPFLHTWSLSVEEQFYLLLPISMWLIFRYRPCWLPGFFLFIIVSSVSLFIYGSLVHPTATFYLLPAREWELGTGCYLALILQPNGNRLVKTESFRSLALLGLCMVIASYLLLPTINAGLAIAVLGTALIIGFAQSGPCNTILAQKPLVHIGKLSYSLYLWHWPVLVFAEVLRFGLPRITLVLPIYLLSLASYYLVEKPTRRRKGLIPWIVCCYVLTLGLSAVLVFSSRQYDISSYERAHYDGMFYNLHPAVRPDQLEKKLPGFEIPKRQAAADAFLHGGVIVGSSDSKPKIVVLGDSMGTMWSNVIRTVTEKMEVTTSFYSMAGVTPFLELPLRDNQRLSSMSSQEKFLYDKARLQFINEWNPRLIILCAAWSRYSEDQTIDLMQYLEARGFRVLLIEQPPILVEVDRRDVMQYLLYKGIQPAMGVQKYFPSGDWDRDNGKAGRELVRKLSGKYANCDYVPVFDLFAKQDKALVLDGTNLVYVDFLHLTTYGTQLALPRIEQAIMTAFENCRGMIEQEK